MPAARSRRFRSARIVAWSAAAAAACALAAGAAWAATTPGACAAPAGARLVASSHGAWVWWQYARTPQSARRQYGARATYRRYSGCIAGHGPQVLFRDYSDDPVVAQVAGEYVGLLDRGGMESLYLSSLLTGLTTNSPAVQDNGGSEANEPGPLLSWTVTRSGWLVYLDTLSDLEGFGVTLNAISGSGATTLDLAPQGNSPSAAPISHLVVKGKTVAWRSAFSGAHRVTLGPSLLPAGLPTRVPTACQLVPRSLARELLGQLSSMRPRRPRVPPRGFWPRVRTGTNRSSCAYAAAADPHQRVAITEQRVSPEIVSRQQRAINDTPHADGGLVLPGIAAVLRPGVAFFPSVPEDLRLFIHGIEIDLTTNSVRAASEIEAAGLAVERALRDAPPAGAYG